MIRVSLCNFKFIQVFPFNLSKSWGDKLILTCVFNYGEVNQNGAKFILQSFRFWYSL